MNTIISFIVIIAFCFGMAFFLGALCYSLGHVFGWGVKLMEKILK